MLLPADAVPRESRRRGTRQRDRKWETNRDGRQREEEIGRQRIVYGDGREGRQAGGGWVGSERDEKLRCGRSEEVERGKKLGTKHDISLAESGHFLPRLFRRVLRL